eukprot:gene27063-34200_t
MAITADQILDIIAEEVPIDRADLKPEATLEALNIASLDMISVMFALEDKFGVIIEQTDVDEVKTLAEIITVVQGKAESKAAAG